MRRRVILLFLLFTIFQTVLSQTSSIKGKVLDGSEKEQSGLPGAVIQNISNSKSVQTDLKGKFEIEASIGDTILCYFTGYITDSLVLTSIPKFITFKLKSGIDLNEVNVTYRTKSSELSMKNITHLETMNEKSLMKAACCNLSESFETNPSVDVSFSDAVSGAKQIQLLGLAGKYAQITKENLPYMRGLSNAFGLTFIPGTWIESIQLGKGAGSVVNGYESFSGQINTQLKDAESKERLFFNAYGNQNGRNEYNLNLSHKFNHKFSTTLLNHASFNPLAQDMNGDLFVDIPTGRQYNFTLKNQLFTNRGFEWQFGGNFMSDERRGGQILPDNNNFQTWNDSLPPYLINIDNTKYDIFSKSGYVFKRQATSMGLQLNYTHHELTNKIGLNNYDGRQQTFYANYIFESYIGNTNHKFKIGSSFVNDIVNEEFNVFKYKRNEQTTGVFGEYVMTPFEFFNLIIGSRLDYSNYYGFQYTPRIHGRFEFNEDKTVFRFSGGKAWRTANIFSDNIGLMASSRIWNIYPSDFSMPYGLNQEIGWNYGINFTQKFSLAYREGYITFDVYRTDFTNQVITDIDEHPQQVNIYNLRGESFTNTGQIEVSYELLTRLDFKIAYRYVDNQVDFRSGQREMALISKHKGFLNLGYETYDEHWLFDATLQYNGSKRLPETYLNPLDYQLKKRSPEFWNLFGQITYKTEVGNYKFDTYVGIENALNFRQDNPILAVKNPYSSYFDASMVWGPIYGRMIYAGLRFKIR